MSAVSDSAHVTLFIADFAVIGADGKANAIGAGWQIVMPILTPEGPRLPALSVACIIEIPQAQAGEQTAISLAFRDAAGEPMLTPVAEGVSPQPVRIAQLAVVQKPQVQGIFVPPEVPCRIATAATLPAGLPVELGTTYSMSLDIDGETKPDWSASFYVVHPPAGPVFG